MGGRGDASSMSARSKSIAKIENKIRNKPVEHAALVNENGDILFDKTEGSTNIVNFTPEECAMMKDATLTHNHPGGTTFSPEDVGLLTTRGLQEIRAVHTNGVYTLTRNYKIGDKVPSHYKNAWLDYRSAITSYVKNTTDAIYAKTGDANKCNKMVSDYKKSWLSSHAAYYGLTYKEG